MSRIGKQPIVIPEGVEVVIQGSHVKVKGPKGELSRTVNRDMSLSLEESVLTVTRPTDSTVHRSYHGLTRTLIDNMVQGVSRGFEKHLEIVGVGYKVQELEGKIVFNLGYSHTIELSATEGISITLTGNNKIAVSGIDKELVGRVAANIRSFRPPDSYKGKGVRYAGERVRLKAGKSGKVGARK